MAKGYVYIMTTAVDGIIKIGKSDNWNRRCQSELETNGYRNMNGLKTYFVIECSDYSEIENIMHDIFRESRVIGAKDSKTELFAVDKDRAKRVLSRMGTQVFPEITNTINSARKSTTSKYTPFWNQLSKYANNLNTKCNLDTYTSHALKVPVGYSEAWAGICFNSLEEFKLVIDFASNDFELFEKLKKKKTSIEKDLGFSLNWIYRTTNNNNKIATAYLSYDFDNTMINDNIDTKLLNDAADKAAIIQQVFTKYVSDIRG